MKVKDLSGNRKLKTKKYECYVDHACGDFCSADGYCNNKQLEKQLEKLVPCNYNICVYEQ